MASKKYKTNFKMLDCPHTTKDVLLLSTQEIAAIYKQNQKIAAAHFKVTTARVNDSDVPKNTIVELRINELKYIVDQRVKYSWQERDISARELLLMGYDVRNHYSLEKYCER